MFGIYVRSVPPKQPKPQEFKVPPNSKQGVPDFMNIQVDPSLKGQDAERAALEQAKRLIEEREAAAPGGGGPVDAAVTPESSSTNEEEVVEL
jgi:hypothetical protein